MTKWVLIDYFDVWGNEEDGWDVNNLTKIDLDISLSENYTHAEVIDILKEKGYLTLSASLENIEIVDNYENFIEFFVKSDGQPFCRLERL